MKFVNIMKQLKEEDNLGMNVSPRIIMKLHSIIKKDFPDCELIQEYPNATAFYHYINKKWK